MLRTLFHELFSQKFRLRYIAALLFSSLSGILDIVTTAIVFYSLKSIGGLGSNDYLPTSYLSSDNSSFALLFLYLILFVLLSGATRVIALKLTTFLSFDFSSYLLTARFGERLHSAPLTQHLLKADILHSLFGAKANSFCTDFIFSVLYVPVAFLNIIFILISLFVINKPVVFIVFFLLSLMYVFFVILQRNKLREYSQKISTLQTEQASFFEMLASIDMDLKLHKLENKCADSYTQINSSLRKCQASIMFFNGLPRPSVETIGLVILLIVSCFLVFINDFDSLYAIPLIGYIGLKLLPLIQSIFQCYNLGRSSLPVASELFTVERNDPVPFYKDNPFIYQNNHLYVDFDKNKNQLNVGDVLVIHGPSGIGKTTLLVSLATMLFNRTKLCFVGQKGYVVNGTLRDNLLLLSTSNYTDDYLVALLRSFKFDFIVNEQDLNIVVGSQARKLSGGEIQRLSICRALLANPDYLVLDEPTSALNKDLANTVIKLLRSTSRSSILVFVTHDLSIIDPSDYILSLGGCYEKNS